MMSVHALCVRNSQSMGSGNLTLKGPLQQRLSRWQQRLHLWHINWRTRRQLLQLDRHQLQDVGVSVAQAMEEADKPFWKD